MVQDQNGPVIGPCVFKHILFVGCCGCVDVARENPVWVVMGQKVWCQRVGFWGSVFVVWGSTKVL